MSELLRHIYQHPQFSEDDLESIFSVHQKMTFQKGDILLKENEIADEYYVLEEGLVRAYVHDFDNNEITTEFFVEKEIVIVPASLFQRIPSKETLQAVTDCVLWKIDFEKFQELFENVPALTEWGRLWFSFQVFSMKQRSIEIITETATHRYLKLLKEKSQIIRDAPLKQIATFLGVTDTSLSRIRREIFEK